MKRKEIKKQLIQLIKDLREYAVELENLYYDMDEMTEDDFNEISEEIQTKYAEKHIELIG